MAQQDNYKSGHYSEGTVQEIEALSLAFRDVAQELLEISARLIVMPASEPFYPPVERLQRLDQRLKKLLTDGEVPELWRQRDARALEPEEEGHPERERETARALALGFHPSEIK